MLKFLVTNETEIPENLKSFYEKTDDGFKLKVDGINDFESKIHNKSKEILSEKKSLQEKLKAYEFQLQQIEEEKARKKGDYESLLKSVETKRAENEAKLKSVINKYHNEKKQNLVKDLASQLCDGSNMKLIAPHLASRLSINEEGEIGVLDHNGNLSVNTLEDLINEFRSNPDFAHVLKGIKASGGNAIGSSSFKASTVDFSKLSMSEKINLAFNKK